MSFTPARLITSPQVNIHENLEKTLIKHLQYAHKKPISEHNQQAFDTAYAYWKDNGKPKTILDSGCGTGESSRYLAKQFSDYLVIGLDQSEKRLNHQDNNHLPENCLLLRCECSDFWALAAHKQWQFTLHTLFYPNPYPKSQHLQRRWHGHAAFKNLLSISQQIILRTNWELYAKEFSMALDIAKREKEWKKEASVSIYSSQSAITAFERKYQQSNHTLWQVLSLADNTKNPL